jgi:hypothetical protein
VEGYSRGMAAMHEGPNEHARALGIHPVASVQGNWYMFNEVGLHAPYREWARLMEAGVSGTKAFE